MDKHNSRRTFISGAGSLVTAGVIGSTIAAGRKSTSGNEEGADIRGVSAEGNEDGLPIQASGKTIRKYRPNDDGFEVTEKFIAQGLSQRYGTNVVNFDPVQLPASRVPEEYRDPERPFTVSYPESAVIGTDEQHLQSESTIKSARSGGSTKTDSVSSSTVSTQTVTYDGPLYQYKSGSAAENENVSKRTAPINLNWTYDVGKSVSQIKSYMKDRGWTSCCAFYSQTRYVLDGDSSRVQDTNIYKEIDKTEQRHIRLYDVGASDSLNTEIVGQIHRDPYDHNQIGDKPWDFNFSRDVAKADWDGWGYNTSYHTESETEWEWDTHDGRIAVISDAE
ncbi:hypothetical protein [Halolamina salifodinae]|uniref:Uncharacterized protein n=1 Tax=Halolamina salifodinae TaxID=1202767 RepID=A0A8T4GV30_9EURY|nr:hypothetical protein [Halolamina salifodinae]MBP1986260.1 hypothetical protein [Halolamina salifodinae]